MIALHPSLTRLPAPIRTSVLIDQNTSFCLPNMNYAHSISCKCLTTVDCCRPPGLLSSFRHDALCNNTMRKKSYSFPLHSLEMSGHVECNMQVAVFIADIRGSAISSRKSFLCVAGKGKKPTKQPKSPAGARRSRISPRLAEKA